MITSLRLGRVLRSDLGFLFIVAALLILGLVMVYSASYGFALIEDSAYYGQPTYFVKKQILFAVLGLIAMFVGSRIDYHVYQRFAVHILVFIILILLPMLFAKNQTGGAARWFFQGSVQPAELARVGATIYIAVWLAAKGEQLRDIKLGLIPFAALLGFIAALIILQPNFSTAVLLVATATMMFFLAGADMRQMLITFFVGGLVLVGVALAMPYRAERIAIWLNSPLSDAFGKGFQVAQSLVALNYGGLVGVGLGQSQQKFAIFAPHTDSMFAIIGEELGFFGSILVIGLYGLWTWRGLLIAWRARDTYGMLLAGGLVCWVTFQAALHIAVATASTPSTGTVLPFISYGGSSLISCLASVGILVNIARNARLEGQRTPA
jgi:cell division protein FtsW